MEAGIAGKSKYGMVSLNKYGVDGQICSSFWLDTNAMVVCRQLGFLGGRATIYKRSFTSPVLVTDYLCLGNESKLTDCKEDHGICYSRDVAGVVCYSHSGK